MRVGFVKINETVVSSSSEMVSLAMANNLPARALSCVSDRAPQVREYHGHHFNIMYEHISSRKSAFGGPGSSILPRDGVSVSLVGRRSRDVK